MFSLLSKNVTQSTHTHTHKHTLSHSHTYNSFTHTTPPHTNETKTVKQYLSVTSYVFVCFFFYIFSSLVLLLKQILCKPLNELHNVAIARKPRFYRLGIMLQGGFPKTRESDKHISLHFCSQPSTCVACHIRKSKFL